MIYKRTELKKKDFADQCIAMKRYLHKYCYDKKNFNKLKWHEKDFFFKNLQILKDEKNRNVFDLLKIPEASNYLFEKLILIYAATDNRFDFSKKTNDYNGAIDKKRQALYQGRFWTLLSNWRTELERREGQYLPIILPMRNEKLKELDALFRNRTICKQEFIKRRNYIDVAFYLIYYKVRYYFDELEDKCEYASIGGNDFYADIYTYSHVLSRHYVPLMNNSIGGTINDSIPYIDVYEMPKSLLDLISEYSKYGNITKTTEYLLFEMDDVKYILWIKYGKIPILKNKIGFEVRSFYRCTEQRDTDKYVGLKKVHIREGLYTYV